MSTLKNFKNFPTTRNGDNVIAFTNSKVASSFSDMDAAALSTWYQKNPAETHLGMLDVISANERQPAPLLTNLLRNAGRIEVDGINGSFSYDMPVKTVHGVYTVIDTSGDYMKPGIDNGVFAIILSKEFKPGDVLTCDANYGQEIVVSNDYAVQRIGDGWKHYVRLKSGSKKDFYRSDRLNAGIEYFKTDHMAGEFSTQLSGISGMADIAYETCEFRLGALRGVEATSTIYGGDPYLKGLTKTTEMFLNQVKEFSKRMGVAENNMPIDTVLIGNMFKSEKTGKDVLNRGSVKVMGLMEYLALIELSKMENIGTMFKRGGTIIDIDGTMRSNDGYFHQMRQGFRIGYSRPGAITVNMIRESAEYIYRGSNIPVEQRRMKFRCGQGAYYNGQALLRDEFHVQVNDLAPMLGTERVLPKNPVSGTLDNLKLEMVRVGEVFLPGIGYVSFEHEPALDWMPLTDRQFKGFYGNNLPRTSYCMFIEDITDSNYTNAYSSRPNTNGVNIISPEKNVFYVTPQQGSLHWGFENGRYDYRTAQNIISSSPKFAQTFFCYSSSDVWIRDKSRIVLIELNSPNY